MGKNKTDGLTIQSVIVFTKHKFLFLFKFLTNAVDTGFPYKNTLKKGVLLMIRY